MTEGREPGAVPRQTPGSWHRRFDIDVDWLPLDERSSFGWHLHLPSRDHKVKSLSLAAYKVALRITARPTR